MSIMELPKDVIYYNISKDLTIKDVFSLFSTCKSLWDKNKVYEIVASNLGLGNNGPDNISWVKRTVHWLENKFLQLSQQKLKQSNKTSPYKSSIQTVLYIQKQDLYHYFRKTSIRHDRPSFENEQLLLTREETNFFYSYIRAKNICDVWLLFVLACEAKTPTQLEYALKGSAQDLIDCARGFDKWFTEHLHILSKFKSCNLSYLNLKFIPPQIGKLTNLEV